MNQIRRCDWLPERARWSYLARSGLPAVSRKKNFPESHIINPSVDQACSVKMAGYWPRSFFCEFMDLDSLSVHKHAKKELGQYPAILTSHLVSNPYISSMRDSVSPQSNNSKFVKKNSFGGNKLFSTLFSVFGNLVNMVSRVSFITPPYFYYLQMKELDQCFFNTVQ